jgi:hypothetical protein
VDLVPCKSRQLLLVESVAAAFEALTALPYSMTYKKVSLYLGHTPYERIVDFKRLKGIICSVKTKEPGSAMPLDAIPRLTRHDCSTGPKETLMFCGFLGDLLGLFTARISHAPC